MANEITLLSGTAGQISMGSGSIGHVGGGLQFSTQPAIPKATASYIIQNRMEFIGQALRAIDGCQRASLSIGEKLAIRKFILAAADTVQQLAKDGGQLETELDK